MFASLEMPRDGFLKTVNQQEGGDVKQGTLLYEIDDSPEAEQLKRLDQFGQILAMELAAVTGEARKRKLRTAQIVIDVAVTYREFAELRFKHEEQGFAAGTTGSFVVDQARAILKKSKLEEERANLGLEETTALLDDTAKRLALAKESLESEREELRVAMARLKIQASANGTLRHFYAPGAFVEKGHYIGTIAS